MNDIHRPAGIQSPQPSRLRPEVLAFIDAHRRLGDRCAAIDPLQLSRPADLAALSPQAFGLQPSDWLNAAGTPLWSARTVADLDRCLKAIYCGTLALDASAVRDDERREWLYQRMEAAPPTPQGHQERLALLEHLIRAQTWEEHVALHFPHGKRFSLEGCEALIPLLHALCESAAGHGAQRVLMGMPHRGRVNVMINLLGLPPAQVLDFFDGESRIPSVIPIWSTTSAASGGWRRCTARCISPWPITLPICRACIRCCSAWRGRSRRPWARTASPACCR